MSDVYGKVEKAAQWYMTIKMLPVLFALCVILSPLLNLYIFFNTLNLNSNEHYKPVVQEIYSALKSSDSFSNEASDRGLVRKIESAKEFVGTSDFDVWFDSYSFGSLVFKLFMLIVMIIVVVIVGSLIRWYWTTSTGTRIMIILFWTYNIIIAMSYNFTIGEDLRMLPIFFSHLDFITAGFIIKHSINILAIVYLFGHAIMATLQED